ncbi:hypothetical protein OIU34_17185 [Pararhizobium sp. BT-229]|uniref:hypothetical protein n=1 Tax=Pararhizobium sp. BT-229 TaxID=2986923 RepID=UPI0021F6C377|nr:hypothetical protein [Pararhizobium sp. BT-229]MCV9963636.1 hypothetical protein [Pararhizobium sp. BT-229]
MLKTRLIASAILLAGIVPADADDAIYVVRPPTMQLRANVLPQNAFQPTQAPTTPTNPTTPTPSDGYAFKSRHWDSPPWDSSVGVIGGTVNATTSLTDINRGRYDNKSLPNGWCDILDAESSDLRKKNTVMFVPNMTSGSVQERYIQPYEPGKLAVVFVCDAVNNLPGTNPASRYYGRVLLTVTP